MNPERKEPNFEKEEKKIISEKDRMIGEIADILRERRDLAFDNYRNHSQRKEINSKIKPLLKHGGELSNEVEITVGAEKNFLEGKWDKNTIADIKHLVVDYLLDRPSDPSEEKKFIKEREGWIKLIEENRGEISKEEITMVLREKKAKEETDAEVKG